MEDKELLIGSVLLKFPSLSSTNDFLMQAVKETKTEEGMVVWAYEQTKGKGQRGNEWEAETGKNLMFSILLNPTFLPVKKQFILSMAFSLSITKHLQQKFDIHTRIKWPNDILLNNKKIGGILIENILRNQKMKHSVIGLGLNVNQKGFNIKNATSLKIETNQNYKLETLLKGLLAAFDNQYSKLKKGKTEKIKADYLNNLKGYKEFLKYKILATAELKELKLIDVADNGTASFLDKNGKELPFDFKEIEMLL